MRPEFGDFESRERWGRIAAVASVVCFFTPILLALLWFVLCL